MYLQMETLASTVMKMEDSHMKEMSILILMLKISLETKMEICMHLEMADRLFDGVQKRMKCCLITAVMVSLHPSGKKAVGWSYSNSITEYDFETGTNKERVIDPVEGINSVSVTKDYQAVCGYKESETLLNIYDNNWNEVMTISSTDTESGMLEGVSAFEQTQNGWVIFDSWMENVIFVGFDGAILKEVSYEELFGTLNWPYVNGTCMDEEGNVIVAITDQREDASCYETIIFKLKGF